MTLFVPGAGPRICGALMIAAGWCLRARAHHHLRRVGVTDEQFIHQQMAHVAAYTNAGPYRWLRHPAYTASLLIYGGFGMICLGWGGIAIAAALWPFYEDRIRFENTLRRLARERGVDGA